MSPEKKERLKELNEIKNKGGYLWWRYGTDDNVEIIKLWIEPNLRKNGYGTDLIKKLVKKIIYSKIIFVYTKKDNKIARSFYKSVGFKRGGKLGDNILYWQYYTKL